MPQFESASKQTEGNRIMKDKLSSYVRARARTFGFSWEKCYSEFTTKHIRIKLWMINAYSTEANRINLEKLLKVAFGRELKVKKVHHVPKRNFNAFHGFSRTVEGDSLVITLPKVAY